MKEPISKRDEALIILIARSIGMDDNTYLKGYELNNLSEIEINEIKEEVELEIEAEKYNL